MQCLSKGDNLSLDRPQLRVRGETELIYLLLYMCMTHLCYQHLCIADVEWYNITTWIILACMVV